MVERSHFPTAVCQDIYGDLPHLYSRGHALVLSGDVDVPPVERRHAGSSICLSESVLDVLQVNSNL